MKIRMQSGANREALTYTSWNSAIMGEIVDERGEAAHRFAKEHSANIHTLIYDPRTFQVTLNGVVLPAEDLAGAIATHASQSLLLETTTLGFVETLFCCRATRRQTAALSLLYIEPAQYHRPQHGRVLHRRDFDLSHEVEDFSGIPGAAFMLRDDRPTRAVFLVGYEGQRLEQALDQTAIRPSKTAIVIGVPAFKPGWEMDAFANNVGVIHERHLERGAFFAGAQNPAAAYRALDRIYRSCEHGERLLVGPIGTKPHGIGAALFACDHPEIGVIYDHPKRSKGRSTKIGSWHLFNIEQN